MLGKSFKQISQPMISHGDESHGSSKQIKQIQDVQFLRKASHCTNTSAEEVYILDSGKNGGDKEESARGTRWAQKTGYK